MSESKKRTLEEIRNEYSQLCARTGHLQYQIAVYEKDLSTLNEQLSSLNFEAAALQPPPVAPEAPKEEKSSEA